MFVSEILSENRAMLIYSEKNTTIIVGISAIPSIEMARLIEYLSGKRTGEIEVEIGNYMKITYSSLESDFTVHYYSSGECLTFSQILSKKEKTELIKAFQEIYPANLIRIPLKKFGNYGTQTMATPKTRDSSVQCVEENSTICDKTTQTEPIYSETTHADRALSIAAHSCCVIM